MSKRGILTERNANSKSKKGKTVIRAEENFVRINMRVKFKVIKQKTNGTDERLEIRRKLCRINVPEFAFKREGKKRRMNGKYIAFTLLYRFTQKLQRFYTNKHLHHPHTHTHIYMILIQ